MAAVTSLGGTFLRVKDPEALYAWYEKHLGLKRQHGAFIFPANSARADVALTFFKKDSKYFPVEQPAMLNLQVDDISALLDHLASEGVVVDPKRESYDFGHFGWFTDPEGNRVELFQPIAH